MVGQHALQPVCLSYTPFRSEPRLGLGFKTDIGISGGLPGLQARSESAIILLLGHVHMRLIQ